MNKIEQAISLVEKIGPSLAKDIAAKEAALAALRAIPGPATPDEAMRAVMEQEEFEHAGQAILGFRAAERRIYGDG